MEGTEIERLQVVIDAYTKPIQDELKRLNKQVTSSTQTVEKHTNKITSAFKKMAKTVAVALSITAIISFGKSCIDLGSDLTEVQNVVETTFGEMSSNIDSFAKSAITQFGLSETSAKSYASTIGAMLKSMQVTNITEMSKELTGLAGDMASFYNLDSSEAFAKIRAGISGETEPLKQLGINMSVANLQAYALSQGITQTYDSMNQATQATLRYNYLLSITKDAQGDFAKTSGTWANQTRILAESFNSVKASIGQALINVLTPSLKILNSFIAKLQEATLAFSQFSAALFGDASGGLSSTAADADEIAESMSNAATSAEATKKALAGFDKIQKLSSENSTTSESSTSSGTVTATSLESTNSIATKISSSLQPAIDALSELKKAFEPFKSNIAEGLSWCYEKVLKPLGTFSIGTVIPTFIDSLAAAISVVNEAINALKPLGSWLFDNFLSPLASWTGGVIANTLDNITKALNGVSDWISNNKSLVAGMTTTVIAFAAAWKAVSLAEFLINAGGVVGILNKLKAATIALTVAKLKDKILTAQIVALYIKDKVAKAASTVATIAHKVATVATSAATKIATAVQTAFNVVMNLNPIFLIITGITALVAGIVILYNKCDGFRQFINGVFEGIKTAFNAVVDFITGIFTGVINFFKDNWKTILTFLANPFAGVFKLLYEKCEGFRNFVDAVVGAVKGFFTGLWDGIKNGAQGAWNGIKNAFSAVADFFGNIFSAAWKRVKDVFSVGGKIFDGIKDGILTAFKAVVNTIIKGINTVISVPFKGINTVLKKIKGISILGAKPFNFIKTFDIPAIPLLAKGGVVSSATLSVIGEHGKEAVVPLENNTGWMDKIVSKLAAVLSTESGNITIVLQNILDKKVVSESVINYINGEIQQGKEPLMV